MNKRILPSNNNKFKILDLKFMKIHRRQPNEEGTPLFSLYSNIQLHPILLRRKLFLLSLNLINQRLIKQNIIGSHSSKKQRKWNKQCVLNIRIQVMLKEICEKLKRKATKYPIWITYLKYKIIFFALIEECIFEWWF